MRPTCTDPLIAIGPELSKRFTSVTVAVSLPVTVTKTVTVPPDGKRHYYCIEHYCNRYLNIYITQNSIVLVGGENLKFRRIKKYFGVCSNHRRQSEAKAGRAALVTGCSAEALNYMSLFFFQQLFFSF